MYMKTHILAALREEFGAWKKLLSGLREADLTAPLPPSPLSIKDEMAHLWAWQQRSILRMEGGLQNQEPEMPVWVSGLDPEEEASTDQINAWIEETHKDQSWDEIYTKWRAGYLRLLELGEAIPEMELLDSSRYAWLDGYPLAFILVASYDHHQEHLEKLLARLPKQER